MSENKPSIFLSYGRGDDHKDYDDPKKSFLRKLYNDLTDAGYDVWWDRESMPARGLMFLDEIGEAITKSDKLILIVGPYGLQSKYVQAEWEHAQYICKPIIQLLIKGDYDQLPTALKNYHSIDFRESRDYSLAINELKRILDEYQPDPATTYNLPLLPRGYIERDKFSRLRDSLLSGANSPTVTREEDQTLFIQGSGGIGKSTIVSALGRLCEVRRRYDDGVIWVTLGKNPLIAQKQGDIGVLFGDSRDNYQDPDTGKMHLKRILANKRALIVLDDVWSHKHVQAFMALGARCRMLVTTRDQTLALKIHGHEYDIIKLTETEGLNLLGKWQDREPTSDNPHETAERDIVNLLDGYTLAVALAGAKLRSGTKHQGLLERLQAGHTFQDLQIDDEDKDYNLEISLYVSYVDLSEADQKRFRQLGVLAPNADFDVKLISAIWEDDEQTAQDALNRLADSALLDRTESGRWVQHTVLRAYAHALMEKEENDEHDKTFKQYVQYVTEISEFETLPMQDWDTQIGPNYPHIDYIGDTLTILNDEHSEIYRSLTGDFVRNIQLYVVRRPVFVETSQGKRRRGLNWLKIAVIVYRETYQVEQQATVLNNIGEIYRTLGQLDPAFDNFHQALQLSQIVLFDTGETRALNNIGRLYATIGNHNQALEYYKQSLAIGRNINDRSGEAVTLNNIGRAYDQLGNKQEALNHYQLALPIRREVGDRSGEAITLNNIAVSYQSFGNFEKALEYHNQALPIRREIGDLSGEITTLNNMAQLYAHQGKLESAVEIYKKVKSLMQVSSTVPETSAIYFNLARVYGQMRRFKDTIELIEQGITLLESAGLSQDAAGQTVETMEKSLSLYRMMID